MISPRRVLFLPGASGDGRFWHPVAERLPASWDKAFFDWPGLGNISPRSDVAGLDDLARLVLERAGAGPVDLIAQSMGGVVAMMVALAHPECVRRLVLTATSGGIDTTPFSPEDWRPEYVQEFPRAAAWIREERRAGRAPDRGPHVRPRPGRPGGGATSSGTSPTSSAITWTMFGRRSRMWAAGSFSADGSQPRPRVGYR